MTKKFNVKVLQYPDRLEYRFYKFCINTDVDGEANRSDRSRKGGVGGKILNDAISRARQKIYQLARCNDWQWFLTLTLSPKIVDSFNYDLSSKMVIRWINNFRRRNKGVKYIIVPEPHKSGRWHFHGLASGLKTDELIKTNVKINGRQVYHLSGYGLGWSTATQIEESSRVASYIVGYMNQTFLRGVGFNRKRYWASKNLDKPEEYTLLLKPDEVIAMKVNLEEVAIYKKVKKADSEYQQEVEIIHCKI